MESSTYQLNTEWDDESYAPYYSDESYGYDDEGFLDDIGNIVKTGAGIAGNLLTGNPIGAISSGVKAVGSILGVNTSPASTSGIQSQSSLAGQLTTAGGKQVPIKLPSTVATKQDVQVLQGAIQKINSEISRVASTTTNNGVALTKLTKEVQTVDARHTSASLKQNDLIKKLGVGVDKLGKDLKQVKNSEQMNMMFSLLLQPKLKSITFANGADGKPVPVVGNDTTSFAVKDSKSTDTTTLLLLMTMMGGGENGGGGFGDMTNNPLMMILLLKALGGNDSGGGLF